MTVADLTPVTVTRHRNLRNGRQEIWEAVSTDGVWAYRRTEEAGTPWEVQHVPTGRWLLYGSLPKARRATADGSALAELDTMTKETSNG